MSTMFPKAGFECTSTNIFGKKGIIDLYRIQGNGDDIKKIIHYLENHPRISRVEQMEVNDSLAFLKVITPIRKNAKTITEIVNQNECYVLKPQVHEDNCEIWTIGSTGKKNLEKAVRDIRKVGDYNILFIKAHRFRDYLRQQERKAVILAKAMGHYSWPRRIGVREIARAMGISKTALLHALRKAEAKIIENSFYSTP